MDEVIGHVDTLESSRIAVPSSASATAISTPPDQGRSLSFPGSRAMHRTVYPAASSSGTSRPPMYPDAPVTRQRNGDGTVKRGVARDDSAIWGSSTVSAAGPARGAPGHHGHCRVGPAEQFRPAGGRVMAFSGDGEAMDKQPGQRQRDGQQQPDPQPGAEIKTHMFSVPSLCLLEACQSRPALICGLLTALSCASAGVAIARLVAQPGIFSWIQGMPRWRTIRSNSPGRVHVADSQRNPPRQLPPKPAPRPAG